MGKRDERDQKTEVVKETRCPSTRDNEDETKVTTNRKKWRKGGLKLRY